MPANDARQTPSAACSMCKTNVDAAPATGAAASISNQPKADRLLPLLRSITLTVLIPSEKSCASTAAETMAPTAAETLKARPIANPSRKLCTARLPAPRAPRPHSFAVREPFVAMRRNCSIQQHVGDETNGSQADHELGAQRGTRQIESLWDQIEEGYAYQGACAESEYQ